MLEESRDPTRGASEPDRLWTFTNVAEACPLTMSPLCWTFWLPGNEVGFRDAYYRMGIVPRSEVTMPDDPNERIASCFYGRFAINVDRLSNLISVIPGSSPEDFERDFLGYVREDRPPFRRSYRRLPFMLARTPVLLATHNRRVLRIHQGHLDWWRAEVLSPDRSRSPADLLRVSEDRFFDAMRAHIITRSLLQPVQAQLAELAEQADDRSLTLRIFAGLGDLPETSLASDLWEVSRARLPLSEFIRRHGYHGPAEGNPIGHSWRENPEMLAPLIDAYRGRPDSESPHERERQAMVAHAEAMEQLMAGLGRSGRLRAKLLISRAAQQVRILETGKASFLMGIDGARAAARQLGMQGLAEGGYQDVDDPFYLTFEELTTGPPANADELIAFRRARRAEYDKLNLPVTFSGMPEPVAAPPDNDGDRSGMVVSGVAGSHGVVEGPVRVVFDPEGDETLDPDEILVCRITDPSWAALFTLAAALVIDFGAAASHGAIVAREMGIPCVIGTGDGTRRFRTGDVVRVDGGAGTVTMVRPVGEIR